MGNLKKTVLGIDIDKEEAEYLKWLEENKFLNDGYKNLAIELIKKISLNEAKPFEKRFLVNYIESATLQSKDERGVTLLPETQQYWKARNAKLQKEYLELIFLEGYKHRDALNELEDKYHIDESTIRDALKKMRSHYS